MDLIGLVMLNLLLSPAARGATNRTTVAIYDFLVSRRCLALTFWNIDILCNEQWNKFLLVLGEHYKIHLNILVPAGKYARRKKEKKKIFIGFTVDDVRCDDSLTGNIKSCFCERNYQIHETAQLSKQDGL